MQHTQNAFSPPKQRPRWRLWQVLAAICAIPVLAALALGLLVIRTLALLFLFYLLAQVYGALLDLLALALGQLLSPPGLLVLAACAILYWLLRTPPAQPKG